ncbi:MAG: ABC transporter ATP-binding protein [Candidatus Competibacterales bacterium]
MTLPSSPPPALAVTDLHRAFGGVVAVDGMSLTVTPHSITGLIGPNGAGKTTLFNLISGVIPPQRGRVALFGEDITGLKPHHIARRGLVRTFQLARELTRLTVLENLMLAPALQRGERLGAVLLQLGAVRRQEGEILNRARETLALLRLDALADEYAGNLSGGQKKLLELGRALMLDPALILLDEPGAGVNPSLMGFLAATLQHLHREAGKTFLVIEHDMDLVAKICTQVVVMAEGRPLAEGAYATIARDPRVIRAYLGTGTETAGATP